MTTETPYCNNLRFKDSVYHVGLKAVGTVSNTPNENSTSVVVLFPGSESGRRCSLLDLRLTDEKGLPIEDVPPISGQFPAPQAKVARITAGENKPARASAPRAPIKPGSSLIDTMKATRDANKSQMATLEAEFLRLRDENAKIDTAITALGGKP